MDALSGKNSTGRRVSLLNDGPAPPPQLARLPSITPSLQSQSQSQSQTSSYTASPIGSPPTPRLVRSTSSDSHTMATPSPITPDFAFDLTAQGLHSPGFPTNGFFPPQKDLDSAYSSLPPAAGPLPYHAANVAQPAYFQPQQAHDEQHAASASASRPKKNSYPCPMAKMYACNDYFTTSGHAARHAKKHTGKKDAFCPECNKAFTRKDNMEQHRRTHQSGRNSAKGADRDVKKAKPAAKRPKISPIQQDVPSLSQLSMVDPSLPTSPLGPSSMAPAVQPTESFLDFPQRSQYPDPTNYSMTPNYGGGSYSVGLDALAAAASASGEKRKFDS